MTAPKSLFDFFGVLPDISLMEICKHLQPAELMLGSLESEIWRNAIQHRKTLGEARLDIHVQFWCLQLTVSFPNAKSESFVVKYPSPTLENRSENVELTCERTELHCMKFSEYSFIGFFLKSRQKTIEKHFLETLNFVIRVYRPKLEEICVSGQLFTPSFANQALMLIPAGPVHSFHATCSDMQDEKILEPEAIKHLLENVKIVEDIKLEIPLGDIFSSSELNLDVNDCLWIEDGLFLTRDNLLSMRFRDGKFGVNKFTSEDFNLFLQKWKTSGSCSELEHAQFTIRSDQEINMDDILRDLEGKPWDKNIRDKSCRYRRDWLNLETGMDIFNSNGKLLTVFRSDLRLILITWSNLRPLESAKWWPMREIENLQRQLANHNVDRARIQAQILRNHKSTKLDRKFHAKMTKIEELERLMRTHQKELDEIAKFE